MQQGGVGDGVDAIGDRRVWHGRGEFRALMGLSARGRTSRWTWRLDNYARLTRAYIAGWREEKCCCVGG